MWGRVRVIGIAIRPGGGLPRVRNPVCATDFFLNVQTDCGAHLTSYLMGTSVKAAEA